ncbi:MAG: 23S rRNA (guanosine(2251)-2'-O)-methyltransferase RlmB [Solirubrobacteraceae bacterium]
MIVYGRNAVREAIRGPREVRRAWATERAAADVLDRSAVGVTIVSDPAALERRCGSPEHQGVCVEVSAYRYADAAELVGLASPMIVALDEIQDPQNLGAVCRTAEAVGVTGVVIAERRSAEVTAAVCRASAGAVEHLAVARVRNLADFLLSARDAGCWSYGAAAGAAVRYDAPDYRGGVVLVLGSEGRGLRPRVAAACDQLVALPLRGRVSSLNVSAAAAALMYEILRQRLDSGS